MDPIPLLTGKHIVLGVTGSIAAYKAADLASKLTQAGALVDVIVTEAFRERLANSGLQGIRFAEVWKERVVKLDWRSWDLEADDPAMYPAGKSVSDGPCITKLQPIFAKFEARSPTVAAELAKCV